MTDGEADCKRNSRESLSFILGEGLGRMDILELKIEKICEGEICMLRTPLGVTIPPPSYYIVLNPISLKY
jgi:hypothetical protein